MSWPTHYIPNQPRLEGSPPPRFVLTTPPYPYEGVEELTSNSEILTITPSIGAEDEIESLSYVLGGEMDEILVGFDGGFDELESTSYVLSGEMNDILVSFNAGHDELESTSFVLSGELYEAPVITYENWPLAADQEDLISGSVILSGELV